MTAQLTSGASAAELDAARLLLARMGISPAELLHATPSRPPAPTFAEYIPIVSAAVSAATRRVYGSYWNRILDQWAQRRLDESTPTDVEHLAEHVGTHVVARRNARGGRSAAEHLIAALRCLYNQACCSAGRHRPHLIATPDRCSRRRSRHLLNRTCVMPAVSG